MATCAQVIIGAGSRAESALPPPGDRATLEFAIDRLSAAPDVYCAGSDQGSLRYALAAGAASAQVLTDISALCGPWVFVGPGSLAACGDWLPAAIAERIAGALVFEVCDLLAATASKLVVVRDLANGDRDELEVLAPAVIVFGEKAAPRRYVSRYRQHRVSLAPVETRAGLQDPLQQISETWETLRPRTRPQALSVTSIKSAEERANSVFGVEQSRTDARGAGLPIDADARTCAIHLVRYLIHYDLLPQRHEMPLPELPAAEPPVLAKPIRRQSTTGTPAVVTRAPRLLGEPPGAAHRRQPRLAGGGAERQAAEAAFFPPAARAATSETVHERPFRGASMGNNA